jgi:hypothetical protein
LKIAMTKCHDCGQEILVLHSSLENPTDCAMLKKTVDYLARSKSEPVVMVAHPNRPGVGHVLLVGSRNDLERVLEQLRPGMSI